VRNVIVRVLPDVLLRAQVDLRCYHKASVHVLLMNIVNTAIPAMLVFEPNIFGDARGLFVETFQSASSIEARIPSPFVQGNLSRSTYGVPRGVYLCRTLAHRQAFHSVPRGCAGRRPAPGQSKFWKARVGCAERREPSWAQSKAETDAFEVRIISYGLVELVGPGCTTGLWRRTKRASWERSRQRD
jgi:hypothetical protein